MMADELPPLMLANVEAEAAVLGALMIENSLVDQAADKLSPQDFAEPIHARIFELIVQQVSRGKSASPISLRPFVEGFPGLDEVGGPAYLARLTGDGFGLLALDGLIEQILELSARRKMMAALQSAVDACRDMDATIDEIVAHADTALDGRADDNINQVSGAEAIADLLKSYKQPISGVTCGSIPEVDRILGPMRPKQLVICAARPGMGKAQPLSAKIMTPTGWTTMGAVKIGDAVASIDGSQSVVTGIYPQGAKQIYRITLSDGRSTECCADHLWRVKYREWGEPRILTTLQIQEMLQRKRYLKRLSIETASGDWGSSCDLPVPPWLLGIIIGDGNLCSGQVRFSTADNEIVERVRSLLPAGMDAKHAGGYDYRISGGRTGGLPNCLMDALRDLGLFGLRAHEKFIPPIYQSASREHRLDLLRGLMDSDGWAETFGAIRFSTTSERLASDVCELVRSLGGICSIKEKTSSYTYKGERRQGRSVFTCKIRMMDPRQAFTLDRKISRVGRTRNTVSLTISSIVPTREAEAQCISVSHPSRMYVTDDYIVTHNTAFALSYALGAARNGHGVLFVSLEMSSRELAARMAAEMCFTHGDNSVPFSAINEGRLEDWQMRRVVEAESRMHQMPFHMIDTGSLTTGRLNILAKRYARRFAARGHKLELIVVDYLQLMRTGHREQSRYEAISEVSQSLKAIAKDHGVAVMALAQLSREVEKRPDKRPTLGDLRDSGQIEQDADAVMFLLREEYYLEQTKPPELSPKFPEWVSNMEAVKGRIEFILAKRRNGRPGIAIGDFHGAYQAVR